VLEIVNCVGARTEITAEAVASASSTLVAVTITVPAFIGAVNRPSLEIEPLPADQATAVCAVPLTAAENCTFEPRSISAAWGVSVSVLPREEVICELLKPCLTLSQDVERIVARVNEATTDKQRAIEQDFVLPGIPAEMVGGILQPQKEIGDLVLESSAPTLDLPRHAR